MGWRGAHAVVADRKTLWVSQALAMAQDPQPRHQQQVSGRNPHPKPHPGVRDRLEVADWIEIGCSKDAFAHKEDAFPPI